MFKTLAERERMVREKRLAHELIDVLVSLGQSKDTTYEKLGKHIRHCHTMGQVEWAQNRLRSMINKKNKAWKEQTLPQKDIQAALRNLKKFSTPRQNWLLTLATRLLK